MADPPPLRTAGHADRIDRSLPRALYLGAVLAFAGLIGMGLFADHQNRSAFERRQQSEVADEVNRLRANLEALISGELRLIVGLTAVLAAEPDLAAERFEALARKLLVETATIRNIAAAPDMVIRMVHPLEGNEAALGLDYRTVPDQWEAAERARAAGHMVVAGPLRLVQGGEGLVARMPVFLDPPGGAAAAEAGGSGPFWGLVAAVLDTERLYRASGLLAPGLAVELALVGRDGLGAEGEVFFGDPAILADRPVTAEVALPEGRWLVAAVPAGGWAETPPRTWLLWLAVLGFGALVVAPLPIAGRLAEDRQRTIGTLEERERELVRLSRRLDLALSASTVGVWDYNIDRDELIWDTRMNELYGMPGDKREHSYLDWRERLHPDDLAEASAVFQAAIEGRARYETRFRLLLPGGEIRHIRAIGAVYREPDGTSKIVGVNWDVTAEVERERELEDKRREAEAASVAKSRFLATMSHEIRTPMSGVLGMLDLLMASRLDAEQRLRAEIARGSATTLLTILNDILDLSKLEADRLTVEPVDLRIDTLIDAAVALFQPQADAKGIALVVEVAPHVPLWLVCDPVRLRQILVNLLSNAVKFTDAGRITVAVDWERGAERLRVVVEDTGIGIAPEDGERLFDPFTQLDGALDRRAGGTGLGLAICRQLAALMGGQVSVESVPGRGSRFVLTIASPRGVPPAEAVPAREAAAPVEPRSVLLVEDNPTNQMIVRAMLERDGHAVTSVDNGREALALVAPGRFDLVLMDVQMPLMDGPTTTRAIRALGPWAAALPIVALTANAMAGDRERYLALGMDDYLSKPVDPRALAAVVTRATAGRSAATLGEAEAS
jgi:signal transduction histidine kinase/sensor domain CHASE-containing protein/ActR/RegA family two-component response regulator